MRSICLIVLLPLMLAACGSTERKTVVVNAPPGSTVVVPADGEATVVR
jgi:hypothetical protein